MVTRPDRPQGRSLRLSPPPVKSLVQELKPEIPILQPEKASTPEIAEILAKYEPDLFIVVAFGEIIKKNLLEIPKLGPINIHTSLLPKYRGAAPIQRALMDGVQETGISIIEMVLQMDAGDVLEMVKMPVTENMTFGELEEKLENLACIALEKVLLAFKKGAVRKIPQNPEEVTFANKITPQEEEINWHNSARSIHNQIRALSPSPGAWCWVQIGEEKKRLKIKRSLVIEKKGAPGELLSFGSEGWIVACGKDALRILEIQLEGKKEMRADDFLKGIKQSLSFVVRS